MQLGLKVAILRSGKSQRQVSAEAGLSESRLSSIVRGWVRPLPDERAAIARALERPERDLFGAER